MVKIDRVALATIADFLINVAAGWFAAGFGALSTTRNNFAKIVLLTADLGFGIVCLLIAIWLRRKNK